MTMTTIAEEEEREPTEATGLTVTEPVQEVGVEMCTLQTTILRVDDASRLVLVGMMHSPLGRQEAEV